MHIEFTSEEKAEYFDRIASHFYNANFGQLSKSDMEILMFDIYIDKMISMHKNDSGTIDYNKCSDYRISKDLGITQQRVRNLKIKKQLRNPVEYDWKCALAGLIKNARYDEATHKITLNIPDPNLYLEIQNYLEEQGAYIEKQLNSKILQMRAEYFLELSLMLEPEANRKDIIKAIKNDIKQSHKDNIVLDEKHIGKTFLSKGLDLIITIMNLPSEISFENKVGQAFIGLLKSFCDKP